MGQNDGQNSDGRVDGVEEQPAGAASPAKTRAKPAGAKEAGDTPAIPMTDKTPLNEGLLNQGMAEGMDAQLVQTMASAVVAEAAKATVADSRHVSDSKPVSDSKAVHARRFHIITDAARDALLTDFGKDTLDDRYLLPGETYQDLFARVADAYADDQAHAQRLYDYVSRLWFMPATPVLSNGGTGRGLPISCYLNSVSDSLEGIVATWNENVWLASPSCLTTTTREGGGLAPRRGRRSPSSERCWGRGGGERAGGRLKKKK